MALHGAGAHHLLAQPVLGHAQGDPRHLQPEPDRELSEPDADHAPRSTGSAAAGWLAGTFVGRLRRLALLPFVVGLGALLSIAWSMGPARMVLVREMEGMTERVTGRIERSWARFDFDVEAFEATPDATNWRAAGRVQHCIEVRAPAPAPAREGAAVVLCSRGLDLNEAWDPADVRSIAVGVPFVWDRDASGRPTLELRFEPDDLAWLEGFAYEDFFHPSATTAERSLAAQLEQPLALTVRAFSEHEAARLVELAHAPGRPERAIPVATIIDRAAALRDMTETLVVLGLAGLMWLRVARAWMGDAHPALGWIVAVGSLAAIPWWGHWLPGLVRSHSVVAGGIFDEVTRDVSPMLDALERSSALDEERRGEIARMWTIETSRYARTFGSVPLALPGVPPADASAALAAIVAQIEAALERADDVAAERIFRALATDDAEGWNEVGVAFVPAARRLALDAARTPEARRAALDFLDEALTQPVADPRPGSATFEAELALWAGLLDFPVDPIRNRAAWIFERSGVPAPES